MRRSLVATLGAAGGALAAAVPGGGQHKGLLGLLSQTSSAVQELISCEETYGSGWETCGDQNSTSCYNPALGHSCCSVNNSYCRENTWCAPVAGYCCLAGEDLETCAKTAGFELPGNEALEDLAATVDRPAASPKTQPDL